MNSEIAVYVHTAALHFKAHKANSSCYRKRRGDGSTNGYWVVLPSETAYERLTLDLRKLRYEALLPCKHCRPLIKSRYNLSDE